MNVIKKERSKTYNYQTHNYSDVPKERPRGMSTNSPQQSGRELGIVEKLLSSYGFVQPEGDNSSIFFHYSEFLGDVQSLQIGEPLSFLVRTDRRSGKPVAVQLARIASIPPAVNGYSNEQVVISYAVNGIVETAARLPTGHSNQQNGSASIGRVSYDKGGEMFFLPYTIANLDVGQSPRKGDHVSFCIVQDKRGGELQVRQMRVVKSESNGDMGEADEEALYKGIISSLKDAFGFIERADVVSEIFFHYSQYDGDVSSLTVGDDVGFDIQTRNGKDVATAVIRLPSGSVVFEDLSDDTYAGEIVKAASRQRGNTLPEGQMNGIIEFDHHGIAAEIGYGEKDCDQNTSVRTGDMVKFKVCTDRRDGLERAVNIEVTANGGREKEAGVVCNVKDGFGFIKCCDRDINVFFHFSELVDQRGTPVPGDEMEFFVQQDENGRYSASKIGLLPKGSVEFETSSGDVYHGIVVKEPSGMKSPGKASRDSDAGIILLDSDYEDEDEDEDNDADEPKRTELVFRSRDCKPREFPQVGDEVEFVICTNKRNGQETAKEIAITKRHRAPRQKGFVCALKEHFGFIETADHADDLFFRFSESMCKINSLSLGDEVEFHVIRKNGKQCAENVSKLRTGSIPKETILEGVFDGKVIRSVRTIDRDQPTYEGIVATVAKESVDMEEKKSDKVLSADSDGSANSESGRDSNDEEVEEEEVGERFPFGITSLVDKKDPLHPGDKVSFQVGVTANGQRRAVCIKCVRNVLRAQVESIKGQFGFIAHETSDGKNLFFHMSEVDTLSGSIKQGDIVEFIIVKNHKNAKQSAMRVKRVSDSPKPAHLIRRRENTPVKLSFVAIRKPRGPDGTVGFKIDELSE